MREWFIVRIDRTLIPSSVMYVSHNDNGNMQFSYFRDSATRYSDKGEAISAAERLSNSMSRYQFKVNSYHGKTVWSNRE